LINYFSKQVYIKNAFKIKVRLSVSQVMKAYNLCMLIWNIKDLSSVLLKIKDILSIVDDWVYNS